MNNAEKEIIRDLGIKRLEAECQLLELRRNEFTKRIFDVDKHVKSFIEKGEISNKAKLWLLNRWDECIKEDIKRIKDKWSKKIISTKTRHAQDKTFISTRKSYKNTSENPQSPDNSSSSNTLSNNLPSTDIYQQPTTQNNNYNQIDSIQVEEEVPETENSKSHDETQSKNGHSRITRHRLKSLTCQLDT